MRSAMLILAPILIGPLVFARPYASAHPASSSGSLPASAARDTARTDQGRKGSHWSFLPSRRPALPQVKQANWIRSPVDAFVLAKLEDLRITPSPEADRYTLLRRLSLDLLGLRPTPAEVAAFIADARPDAYERLVDRLLASPHFGERWGKHWLDLARYADSNGYDNDEVRPTAWRWRDWVINALNRDMPFDQFTIEQLAGDLLLGATLEQKLATGFHRNTPTNTENQFHKTEEFWVKTVADRVETTGAVWLGLTVGCCQCHRHKYDPLGQNEYYGLFAFFNNAEEVELPAPLPREVEAFQQAKKIFERQRAALLAGRAEYEKNDSTGRLDWEQELWPAGTRRTEDPRLSKLSRVLAEHARKAPAYPNTKILTLAEPRKPRKTHLLIRGDYQQKGAEVQPATFAVLHPFQPRHPLPNRLDLARWLVDPANPLTARVAVNRIWQHLFGRGIVATIEDFGTQGERPSHPDLLDWLATELLAQGWSQKAIIRQIVLSATYRQASQVRPELLERDPSNTLLARQSRFRVEAEILRDLSLAVSGLLHPRLGGPSFRPPTQTEDAKTEVAKQLAKWSLSTRAELCRRGMYIAVQRTVPHTMLTTFDAPDSHVSCMRRDRSNTPLQALTLLNDVTFFECAQALGHRILRETSGSTAERIRGAFQLCLARPPSAEETARLEQLLQDQRAFCQANAELATALVGTELLPKSVSLPEAAAWIGLGRILLNLDEFITRE